VHIDLHIDIDLLHLLIYIYVSFVHYSLHVIIYFLLLAMTDLQQRIKLVSCYYRSNNSPISALRLYCLENNTKEQPCSPTTVTRLLQRFESTGRVDDLPRTGRPSVSDETVSLVKVSLDTQKEAQPYGFCSLKNISDKTNVPKSTIHKILRQSLELKPYRVRRVQELKETDLASRLHFSQWFLNESNNDDNFFNTVLWTDEAHFFLDGCVYTRNCIIWSDVNPRITVPTSLHPEKVTVWAGFNAKFLLPPYFFETTINGDKYLEMLTNHVVPSLTRKRYLSRTTFQQDGAPPHIKNNVKQFLTSKFGNKIISRQFPNVWPPRSPDLSPADYWLWGTLKHRVYLKKPSNINELKQFISEEMENISPEELQRSCQNIRTRLEAVVQNNGGIFEHLL